MTVALKPRVWTYLLCLVFLLSGALARADDPPAAAPAPAAAGDANVVVSSTPMKFTAEGEGVHGQLIVAPEIITPETRGDLVFTITVEPVFGRVGLAGTGDDFFENKTAKLGYFAYQPQEGYTGEDSFTYTVKNEGTGLVFKNTVVITVKPPPPVVIDAFQVTGQHERFLKVQPVELTTRPNTSVTKKIPSHQDFMTPADRDALKDP
ncbi:MAG TPA: hypothetical protein VFJ90_16455, partial [Candidatus Didemnitutus sp.]|nr:hypothetical protein [Candidatus Didemnitutus sp.]